MRTREIRSCNLYICLYSPFKDTIGVVEISSFQLKINATHSNDWLRYIFNRLCIVHVVPGPELEAGQPQAKQLRFLVWEISHVWLAVSEVGFFLPLSGLRRASLSVTGLVPLSNCMALPPAKVDLLNANSLSVQPRGANARHCNKMLTHLLPRC